MVTGPVQNRSTRREAIYDALFLCRRLPSAEMHVWSASLVVKGVINEPRHYGVKESPCSYWTMPYLTHGIKYPVEIVRSDPRFRGSIFRKFWIAFDHAHHVPTANARNTGPRNNTFKYRCALARRRHVERNLLCLQGRRVRISVVVTHKPEHCTAFSETDSGPRKFNHRATDVGTHSFHRSRSHHNDGLPEASFA